MIDPWYGGLCWFMQRSCSFSGSRTQNNATNQGRRSVFTCTSMLQWRNEGSNILSVTCVDPQNACRACSLSCCALPLHSNRFVPTGHADHVRGRARPARTRDAIRRSSRVSQVSQLPLAAVRVGICTSQQFSRRGRSAVRAAVTLRHDCGNSGGIDVTMTQDAAPILGALPLEHHPCSYIEAAAPSLQCC